jgi:hypothetical protein
MMDLQEIQRRFAAAMMAPLKPSDAIGAKTIAGRSVRAEATAIVKPNDRLTSVERLEIYSRSYWFRILDALTDDFPGLRALLGDGSFHRMARAYLADCPSASFTMRNLGSRLTSWLEGHQDFCRRNPRLALDMARLEWAHVEAFDSAERAPLGPEDLLELDESMAIGLQPYLSLIEAQFPVDDLRIEAQQWDEDVRTSLARKFRRRCLGLKPAPIFIAVHRFEDTVYYRRLDEAEHHTLSALAAGLPLISAIPEDADADQVKGWFTTWSRLGWLCRPESA